MSRLDKRFVATLEKSPSKGGWTYVVMPGSAEFFGTRGLVRVRGNVDGSPLQGRSWRWGWPPQAGVPKNVRQEIGKEVGDTVTVELTERLEAPPPP